VSILVIREGVGEIGTWVGNVVGLFLLVRPTTGICAINGLSLARASEGTLCQLYSTYFQFGRWYDMEATFLDTL